MQRILDTIDQQHWLDPVANRLQQSIKATFKAGGSAGGRIADILHGSWAGHPVHPALTDVPIGAWTVAAICDGLDIARGDDQLAPAADAAIIIGLGAALPTLLTGLTDWQHASDRPKRVGLLHGLLNVTASFLYTASVLTRNDSRALGRGLAMTGYSVVLVSGYLGGELVYNLHYGVSRAPAEPPPAAFTPVLKDEELAEGQLRKVEVEGIPVMLTRRNGRVYALADSCSHLGCSLSEGTLEDGTVVCSCHGSRFALESGTVVGGPASVSQPSYETHIEAGQIMVRSVRATGQSAYAIGR